MGEFFFLLIMNLLLVLAVFSIRKDPEISVSNQAWRFSLLLCSPVALVMIAVIEEKTRAVS
jgi:hypothetical protein